MEVTPGKGLPHTVEFSFTAQNAGELTVNTGDLVSVLRYSDTSGNPEWWLVQCGATTGYIPGSFLSAVRNEDQEEEEKEGEALHATDTSSALCYSAEFDFEASSAAELSISQGQVLRVLQQQDLLGNREWWLVEGNDQKTGYVPAIYLTLLKE